LFAEFAFPLIQVVEVSVPHATDKRWRTLFIPNRVQQRKLIKQCFKNGRHFVGEWHTHPEPKPTPSGLDLKSMSDAFVKSRHELNYFIMVIVGNKEETLELWVSAHDGAGHYRLSECATMQT
jgi:integrative and conjugative element protein (TIGR02256 family)